MASVSYQTEQDLNRMVKRRANLGSLTSKGRKNVHCRIWRGRLCYNPTFTEERGIRHSIPGRSRRSFPSGMRWLFYFINSCAGFSESAEYPGVIAIGCNNWYKHPYSGTSEFDIDDLCSVVSHETIHGVLDSIGEDRSSILIDRPPVDQNWYDHSGLPGNVSFGNCLEGAFCSLQLREEHQAGYCRCDHHDAFWIPNWTTKRTVKWCPHCREIVDEL